MRAFKEQVAQNFIVHAAAELVSTITHNIEVGEGGHALRRDQVISYALFAQALPTGHLFQQTDRERPVRATSARVEPRTIQSAVDQFTNPDVGSSKAANAAALGKKLKHEDAAAVVRSRSRC